MNHPLGGYRYPIAYDKQTGSSSTQMVDFQGNKQKIDAENHPLAHYSQHQHPHQHHQQPQASQMHPFAPQDPFFSANQPVDHNRIPGLSRMGLPPPGRGTIIPMARPLTTQAPILPPNQLINTETTNEQQASNNNNNNNAVANTAEPSSNHLFSKPSDTISSVSRPEADRDQQIRSDPLPAYTPPIFAYNTITDHQLPPSIQPPPPPAVILRDQSYQARQAKLNQQARLASLEQATMRPASGSYIEPPASQQQQQQGSPPNLLAEPYQQQRHRNQMLDRDQLFDLERRGPPAPVLVAQRLDPNHLISPAARGPPYSSSHSLSDANEPARDKPQTSPPILLARQPIPNPSLNLLRDAGGVPSPPSKVSAQHTNSPSCSNSSTLTNHGLLFCNEDREYPLSEVMRALELYAAHQGSIEQLLPQTMVSIYLQQQQKQQQQQSTSSGKSPLDSLQKSLIEDTNESQQEVGAIQASNFDPMCRSTVFMAQPRRAKNLLNQWKVIVNLPGHKYRGIAVSQMVRIEECSVPLSECSPHKSTNLSSELASKQQFPWNKSRCLQQYDNQRLLAWTAQQGLHFDVFRVPISCSCHLIRRL